MWYSYKSNFNKTIAPVIAFALLFFAFSANAYLHFHITDSGKLVAHSHPFSETSTSDNTKSKHSHNDVELFVYGSSAENQKAMLNSTTFVFPIFKAKKISFPQSEKPSYIDNISENSLRAPPLS
jgi:alkaline phosphatase